MNVLFDKWDPLGHLIALVIIYSWGEYKSPSKAIISVLVTLEFNSDDSEIFDFFLKNK